MTTSILPAIIATPIGSIWANTCAGILLKTKIALAPAPAVI